MLFKLCVKYLGYKLNRDKDLFIVYQVNIAMDTFDAVKNINGYKSQEKIHQACNEGAKNFLNSLYFNI